MRSASALKRYCAYPDVLARIPPKDAAERKREANKQASADLGTEFHSRVDQWCRTGEAPVSANPEVQGWLDGLATMFDPHGRDVETELAWGLTMDGVYCPVDEPEPHVYVPSRQFFGQEPLPPLLTAGRADMSWEDNGLVWCPDLKTGKWPVTPARTNLQANASGIALASRVGASGYIPGIYYARDGWFDWGEPVLFGTAEHGAMLEEIRTAALMDEQPRPGEHVCPTCWERKRCGAAWKETK